MSGEKQVDFAPFEEELDAMRASMRGIESVFRREQNVLEEQMTELYARRQEIDSEIEVLKARDQALEEKALHLRRALRVLGDDNGRNDDS